MGQGSRSAGPAARRGGGLALRTGAEVNVLRKDANIDVGEHHLGLKDGVLYRIISSPGAQLKGRGALEPRGEVGGRGDGGKGRTKLVDGEREKLAREKSTPVSQGCYGDSQKL